MLSTVSTLDGELSKFSTFVLSISDISLESLILYDIEDTLSPYVSIAIASFLSEGSSVRSVESLE